MNAPNEEKSAELITRLDRLPFSAWHKAFFAVAFIGIMFDAADFALFGTALPLISREFGLNPAQAGLLATVGLVGAFVGALFWGTISDYIGRRTAFQATVGIFAVFTGLIAASWSVLSLAVFRFLANFGLGGEVPVTVTLASEFSPGRIRGSMAGNILAAFPLGLAVAAGLSLLILPVWGWRGLFLVGVVPALLLLFVRRYMPESVRYNINKGNIAEAQATVEHIERRALGRNLTSEEIKALPKLAADAAVTGRVPVMELLAPGRAKRTLLLWTVSFGFLWASNGILVHATDDPAAARVSVVPGHHLPADSGDLRLLRLLGLRLPGRQVRPPAGSVSLLLHRRLFPFVVRGGERHLALCCHRRGRLGQSWRLRRHRRSMSESCIPRACGRRPSAGSSASDASARSSRQRWWDSCCTMVSANGCCTRSRSLI